MALTRNERDELTQIHRSLSRLHARVNRVTRASQRRDDDYAQIDATLNAQLCVSAAMQHITKALYPDYFLAKDVKV